MLTLKERLLKSGLSNTDIKNKFIDLRQANNKRSAELYLKNIDCTEITDCLGAKQDPPASTEEFTSCLIAEKETITIIYDDENKTNTYLHGGNVLPFYKITKAINYVKDVKKINLVYAKHLFSNGYYYYDWIFSHFLLSDLQEYQNSIKVKRKEIFTGKDVIFSYTDEQTDTYYFFNSDGTIKKYDYRNLFQSSDSLKEKIKLIDWYDLTDATREKILNMLFEQVHFTKAYENIFISHIWSIDLGAKPDEYCKKS